MIDWPKVVLDGLGILGLAIVWADISCHLWLARHQGMRRRDLFALPLFQGTLSLGLLLVCVSFVPNETAVWKSLLWAVFSCYFGGRLVWLVVRRNPR